MCPTFFGNDIVVNTYEKLCFLYCQTFESIQVLPPLFWKLKGDDNWIAKGQGWLFLPVYDLMIHNQPTRVFNSLFE